MFLRGRRPIRPSSESRTFDQLPCPCVRTGIHHGCRVLFFAPRVSIPRAIIENSGSPESFIFVVLCTL